MKFMSVHDPNFGTFGTILTWVLTIFGYITIQDTAFFLACIVSCGTIFLQWKNYKVRAKQIWKDIWKR